MTNLFQKATWRKWRWEYKGNVFTAEDLYDLPIKGANKVTLEKVASVLKAKTAETDVFGDLVTGTDSAEIIEAKEKLELIREIVKHKLEMQREKEAAIKKQQKKELIKELLKEKELETLKNKSKEELLAELNAID